MKTTKNDVDTSLKFPCIMKCCNQGGTYCDAIVLFSEPGKGIIIFSNDPAQVGYYCAYWHMGHFVPYKGSVTLEN